jgi:hypothetical protein
MQPKITFSTALFVLSTKLHGAKPQESVIFNSERIFLEHCRETIQTRLKIL